MTPALLRSTLASSGTAPNGPGAPRVILVDPAVVPGWAGHSGWPRVARCRPGWARCHPDGIPVLLCITPLYLTRDAIGILIHFALRHDPYLHFFILPYTLTKLAPKKITGKKGKGSQPPPKKHKREEVHAETEEEETMTPPRSPSPPRRSPTPPPQEDWGHEIDS